MIMDFEIQLIASIVAISCSLVGVFLVLRNMSMLSDSITHTILLGIVLAFFISHSLDSPLLIVGATVMGVITVYLTETLSKTKLMPEDASIGVIFPLLFSIAIILISRYSGSAHLDTDAVLLGNIEYSIFERLIIGGVDIGPKLAYTMGIVLIINLAAILIFYKEFKLAAFDTIFASLIGFMPVLLHYALMTLVSITAVAAFDAVGSILVVAFMIGPPSAAYLLSHKLKYVIIYSVIIDIIAAIVGYQAAILLDVSISGSIAVAIGIIFAIVFVTAPDGLITKFARRFRQKVAFAKSLLLFHLSNHENTQTEDQDNNIETIHLHLHWKKSFAKNTIRRLVKENKVVIQNNNVKLTDKGKMSSMQSYRNYFTNL